MVDKPLHSVTRSYTQPSRDRNRGLDANAGRDLDVMETAPQPARPRRAYGTAVRPVLNRARQLLKIVGARDELAQPRWPDISWRVKSTRERLDAGDSSLPAKPVDCRITHEDFNIGTGFMQERAGFERTLAAAYHQD